MRLSFAEETNFPIPSIRRLNLSCLQPNGNSSAKPAPWIFSKILENWGCFSSNLVCASFCRSSTRREKLWQQTNLSPHFDPLSSIQDGNNIEKDRHMQNLLEIFKWSEFCESENMFNMLLDRVLPLHWSLGAQWPGQYILDLRAVHGHWLEYSKQILFSSIYINYLGLDIFYGVSVFPFSFWILGSSLNR